MHNAKTIAVLICAAGAALGAIAPATYAAAAPPVKRVSAPSPGGGAIDLDVRSNAGRTLGHLEGHLAADGKGALVFRPAPGVKTPTELVHGSAKPAMGGALRLTADGDALDAAGTFGAKGRITGSGTLEGKPIHLTGVGREASVAPKLGMKMLVVGSPTGTGYKALKSVFDPVRYDPATHTRGHFLADRKDYARYGALVIGKGVSGAQLRHHALLRSFYGSGRWIVAAPDTTGVDAVLSELHSGMTGKGDPAVAIRQAGPEGNATRVKMTVPLEASPRGKLDAKAHREEQAGRQRWFRSEIIRESAAHMSSARELDADPSVRKLAGSDAGFNLPYNAAAIEIAISSYHPWTLTNPGNSDFSHPCAMNTTTANTWCEDTSYWQQMLAQNGNDKGKTCQWFLDNGYDVVPKETVQHYTEGKLNDSGAYTMYWGDFNHSYVLKGKSSDRCPRNVTQTGALQGRVYYYAIYDPQGNNGNGSHTLVALTDPTVSASDNLNTNGGLALEGATSGNGGFYSLNIGYDRQDMAYKEDAWFLGRYDANFSLWAGNEDSALPANVFEYSQAQSYPNNEIEYTSDTNSQQNTRSFTIGTFEGSGTTGYGQSTSEDASVTVNVPDWKVLPTAADHKVKYSWQTNTKLSWDSIAAGGNALNYDASGGAISLDDSGQTDGPFSSSPTGDDVLNPLNRTDFTPATVTSWSGDATYGKIDVYLDETAYLVDHWSRYDLDDNDDLRTKSAYTVTPKEFDDNPNDLTPNTTKPDGTGIDLCDPLVMAPKFKSTTTTNNGCPLPSS